MQPSPCTLDTSADQFDGFDGWHHPPRKTLLAELFLSFLRSFFYLTAFNTMMGTMRFSTAPVAAAKASHPMHVPAFSASRAQGAAPLQQRLSSSISLRLQRRQITCAAEAEVGKLISKVEIPAFIPRQDLMDQLLRWATIEIQEAGVANVGTPCKVRANQERHNYKLDPWLRFACTVFRCISQQDFRLLACMVVI
jgi:hypothetical protein